MTEAELASQYGELRNPRRARHLESGLMRPPSGNSLLIVRQKQFFTFALVGIVGTAAHYLVLMVLVEALAAPVLLATTLGFTSGAIVNYALNRRFTFDSMVPHYVALPKFFAVAVSGALLNAAVVVFLVQIAGWHYLVGQLLATGLVLLWNFTANMMWTFRK